jgi:hypothetical protein
MLYIVGQIVGTCILILLLSLSYILRTGRRRYSSHLKPVKIFLARVRLMFMFRPTVACVHKHCLELAKCNAGPSNKRLRICEPIYGFNLLETSGPVQACSGIALSFTFL